MLYINHENKRIASSDASLPKGRRSRGLREEPESGTVLGTTLRRMQQPMRWISWAASLCLPLPVDNEIGVLGQGQLYMYVNKRNVHINCPPY